MIRMQVRGTLSESDLLDLERRLSHRLPPAYREFLKRTNGGEPEPNKHEDPDVWVTSFLGLGVGTWYDDLLAQIEAMESRVPAGFIPIANSECGNLICMSLRSQDFGAVYFWDHELEIEEGYLEEDLRRLDDDFQSFFESLEPFVIGSDQDD